MVNEILGKKIRMTQVFSEDGARIPVTLIEAGPNFVVQKKTVESDGYNALQVGYLGASEKSVNRPRKMHFEKSKVKPTQELREIRLGADSGDDVTTEINISIFKEGDRVDVSGVSKGRGFAGVFKRHNMGGAPASRGAHEAYRHVGSLGGSPSTTRRVWLGRRLPGHMGCDKVTVLNLEVVRVIKDTNHLLVKGAVPGANGGILRIRRSNRGN